MQPRKTEPPALRRIKGRRNSVVTLYDHATHRRRTITVGPADDPDTRRLYHRVIAEWEGSGRRLGPHIDRVLESRAQIAQVRRWQIAYANTESTAQIAQSRERVGADVNTESPSQFGNVNETITIGELVLNFLHHINTPDSDKDLNDYKAILRLLVDMFGDVPVDDFGPKALRQLRQAMISGDAKADPPRRPWTRSSINRKVSRLRTVFKWAAGHELVDMNIAERLKSVEPLREGKTTAPETDPVMPVDDDMVDAIRSHVSRQVWAMIQLQRFTGARPGEVVNLKASDIDMTGDVWKVRLSKHKTAWKGKSRTIYIGPKAQHVIRPFLTTTGYLFSPRQAEHERRHAMRESRTAHLSTNKTRDAQRATRRTETAGEHYTVDSYRRAIHRACKVAKVEQWSPNQLRHNAATHLAATYGLEAARVMLGHSSATITAAVYVERDEREALKIAREAG